MLILIILVSCNNPNKHESDKLIFKKTTMPPRSPKTSHIINDRFTHSQTTVIRADPGLPNYCIIQIGRRKPTQNR